MNFTPHLEGNHLPGHRLEEIVSSEKMIIIHFLRHLGCVFCQHTVDQLFSLKQQSPNFPTIYFVHQGTVEAGEAFFARHFPEARHISDPSLKLYRHFGIRKLKGFNLLNPVMMFKGMILTLKGYINRYKGGDMFMLSGTFLFNNGKLVWQHRAKFAGDDPKFERLLMPSAAGRPATSSPHLSAAQS